MKRFWFQSTLITLFVFFMLWVANMATDLNMFQAFDSVGQAMKDFELTNYAFSRLRPTPEVDERIVLVNIGPLGRRGIAEQIMAVNQYKPKVIGIDVRFCCDGGLRDTVNCPALKDVIGNIMLSNAIQEAGNIVLGSRLLQTDSLAHFDVNEADSLELADPIFSDFAKSGFVTLPTNANYQEDIKVCNSIFPKWNIGGKQELAFSVSIANQYDSAKAQKFLARNNEEELINFRGNIEVLQEKIHTLKSDDTGSTRFGTMFYVVDVEDILKGQVLGEMFQDKIVLMGYLGDYLGQSAWEDKFFTPLNKKLAGRANPDMFGVVLHANAIAMILNEDYVDQLADWQKYSIAFLVCLLTVALFVRIDQSLPMWFDALSVFIQLLEVLIISSLVIYAFYKWSWKLDLTIAIGVSALVGPCYDIFKSLQNEVNRRLAIRRENFLKKYAD